MERKIMRILTCIGIAAIILAGTYTFTYGADDLKEVILCYTVPIAEKS